jgi:hypothetical protein
MYERAERDAKGMKAASTCFGRWNDPSGDPRRSRPVTVEGHGGRRGRPNDPRPMDWDGDRIFDRLCSLEVHANAKSADRDTFGCVESYFGSNL